MRKIAIVFCLLGLLIGTTFVGQAIAQSPNPQHGFIAISPHHGATGTMVVISGKGWQPGQPGQVDIYIDTIFVKTQTLDQEGKFVGQITMSATTSGFHEIRVVQNGMEAIKKFKVEATS